MKKGTIKSNKIITLKSRQIGITLDKKTIKKITKNPKFNLLTGILIK